MIGDEPVPDFVIAGVRLSDDKVRVVASRDLHEVTLDFHADREAAMMDPFLLLSPRHIRITMTAEMLQCVRVEAPSYPEAMESLWEYWRRQGEPALPEGQKGIEQ